MRVAALSPAAYSMISDYFPPSRRARALAVYSMGPYLGAGLALMIGGGVIDMITRSGAAGGTQTLVARQWATSTTGCTIGVYNPAGNLPAGVPSTVRVKLPVVV